MDARIQEAFSALGQAVAFRSASARSLNAATELARVHNTVAAVEVITKFQQRLLLLRLRFMHDIRRSCGRIHIERRPYGVRMEGNVPLRNPGATEDEDSDGDGTPVGSDP